jgi:RNA polymerase sigma-70 factor, ECF subfamily
MDPDSPFAPDVSAPASSTWDAGPHVAAREMAALMEAAIDRLPDGAREVFVLRHVEGMSAQEVAGMLDVSEAAIEARFSRACAALRRDLYTHARIARPRAFRCSRGNCDRVVAAVLARLVWMRPRS